MWGSAKNADFGVTEFQWPPFLQEEVTDD
jgi:hypothetical protein